MKMIPSGSAGGGGRRVLPNLMEPWPQPSAADSQAHPSPGAKAAKRWRNANWVKGPSVGGAHRHTAKDAAEDSGEPRLDRVFLPGLLTHKWLMNMPMPCRQRVVPWYAPDRPVSGVTESLP